MIDVAIASNRRVYLVVTIWDVYSGYFEFTTTYKTLQDFEWVPVLNKRRLQEPVIRYYVNSVRVTGDIYDTAAYQYLGIINYLGPGIFDRDGFGTIQDVFSEIENRIATILGS